MSNFYREAGVDVEAGYKAVNLMKSHVEKTFIKGVMNNLGGFGGAFDLSEHMVENPVLVSGTDGVGTKLMLAFEMDKHDTIGIDAVAMCVNDIVAMGAKPLYFLDYIATGKLNPSQVEDIVKGISEGCIMAGCALIGGETAEMPDMYKEGEYDLAGYTTGIVSKDKMITGENVKEGNILIGLASSGLHSNGFSLIRKIIKENGFGLNQEIVPDEKPSEEHLVGKTLGEALLIPTKIYVKEILYILKTHEINGISHITGGGFYENIPRMLPKGLAAKINVGSWEVPNLFTFLQREGNIPEKDMYGIFNMGIGMVLAVNKEDAQEIQNEIKGAFIIGEVIKGEGVILEGQNDD